MAAFRSLGGFIATFSADARPTDVPATEDCTLNNSSERYLGLSNLTITIW